MRYTLDETESSPPLRVVLTSKQSAEAEPDSTSTGVLPLMLTSASLLEPSSTALVKWFTEHVSSPDADGIADVVARYG